MDRAGVSGKQARKKQKKGNELMNENKSSNKNHPGTKTYDATGREIAAFFGDTLTPTL